MPEVNMSKKSNSPQVSYPREFKDVNKTKSSDYWDYENHEIIWELPDKYELIQKIGRGKYSDVFEGIRLTDSKRVVIKVLKPVKPRKILREVKILENLKGGVNIITLLATVRDPLTNTSALIFEYVNNVEYKELYFQLSEADIKYYLNEVLKALQFCHSKGIMHRDVKPQNIMIDHSKRIVKLIDWGLAEFYHPGELYNVRVASRFFKGPELLVQYQMYNYALDMWSFGCILAGIIFKKEPFFQGQDNKDQLVKIVDVLGRTDLVNYANKYNITIDKEVQSLTANCVKVPWNSFVNSGNKNLASPEVIDLIDKLLRFDHEFRLTVTEAMNHVYFSNGLTAKKGVVINSKR